MSIDLKKKSIKKIAKMGLVKNSEIIPILNKEELQNVNPDDIAQLALNYKTAEIPSSKIFSFFFSIINTVMEYVFSILGAVLGGEYIAVKEFADSLLKDKLKGFGNSFLYWIGMKKIEISGPEMFTAFGQALSATPKILIGILIGAILGNILWKLTKTLLKSGYKNLKFDKKLDQVFKKYK